MGFFTELFSRPRPVDDPHDRIAPFLLEGMSHSDRVGTRVPPADFPRVARRHERFA